MAWAALVLALALAYRGMWAADRAAHPPALDLGPVEAWFFSPSGPPLWLVAGLSAWLALRRFPRLRGLQAGPRSRLAGRAGLTGALALLLWGSWVAAPRVLPLSLALFTLSLGLRHGGIAGARALALPAACIGLLGPPIPPPLLNHVLPPLQLFTAEAATTVLRLLGESVQQAGDLVITPWANFRVIETCAGLQSTLTLVMAAIVYGEWAGLGSRRRGVLLLAAPLVGQLVNVLRVLWLIEKPTPETQPEHGLQGLAMIVVGTVLLFALDLALEWRGRKNVAEPADGPLQSDRHAGILEVLGRMPGRAPRLEIAALACVAIGIAFVEPRPPSPPVSNSAHDIPKSLGAWQLEDPRLPVDTEYLGSVRFSSRSWRAYRRDEDRVTLFLGLDDRLRYTGGLVSWKTFTLASGHFTEHAPRPIDWEDGALGHEVVVGTADGRRFLVQHAYANQAGLIEETLRSALGLERSPWRRMRPARVVRLATPLAPDPAAVEVARARLEDFRRVLAPHLAELDGTD